MHFCVSVHVCICVCTCEYMYVCMYVCMCACTCIYRHVYVCTYIFVGEKLICVSERVFARIEVVKSAYVCMSHNMYT